MNMKKTIIRNIYYIVAFGYVFIGVGLLDWSFNMVPPTTAVQSSEIMRILIVDSLYILAGVLLYFATFFIVRGKIIGDILLGLIFWGGITLVFGRALIVIMLNKLVNYPTDYLMDFPVNVVFFIPIIVLFVNRKSIRGTL